MGDAALAPPTNDHVDVIVVGGGPTGLFLGLLARKVGLSVTVLGAYIGTFFSKRTWELNHTQDSKPGPLEFGRADAINARTQQYFELAGLLDDLLVQGIKCNSKIHVQSTLGLRLCNIV